jgi:molecular chaperone GrpE
VSENAETANVQDEEQTQEGAASAAETVEERSEAVEATEGAPESDGASKSDAAETEPEPLDPEAALQEALAQAEAQASEYLDGWQRARAEFANYRRREQVRREQADSEVAARVLGHFLPVLDDLERAFSSVPPDVRGDSWVEGLSLVAQKMLAGMEKEGVTPMSVEPGDEFDPNYHMAVLHSPCADYDAGQVAAVLQRGYMIGDRVLRPAMVQVSSERTCDEGQAGARQAEAGEPADEPAGDPNE